MEHSDAGGSRRGWSPCFSSSTTWRSSAALRKACARVLRREDASPTARPTLCSRTTKCASTSSAAMGRRAHPREWPMLDVQRLDVSIGPVSILRQVSLSLPTGKGWRGVIGRNGAGKTNADAFDHGGILTRQGRCDALSRGRSRCRTRASSPFARHRLHAEDRCLVPQLTVEENILLPLWVSDHLDRKARLDFVYEVIGELTEMRQCNGQAADNRSWSRRPGARHRHQMPAAR